MDPILSELAARQHGIVTRTQLLRLGMRDASIHHRVKQGRLHPQHPGVYAVGVPARSRQALWMAAVLACGDRAALSHRSAAVTWKLIPDYSAGIHVTARGQRRLRGEVQVHLSRTLRPELVVLRDGIPVTIPERTIVDLSELLSEYQVARAIHEGVFLRLINLRRLQQNIEAVRGRRTVGVACRALQLHLSGSAGTRSRLEERFLALVLEAGLPLPEVNVQVEVPAARRRIEVDFLWRVERLCVEIDGPGHRRPTTQADDEAREALLQDAGFRVWRVPSSNFTRRTSALLRSMLEAPA